MFTPRRYRRMSSATSGYWWEISVKSKITVLMGVLVFLAGFGPVAGPLRAQPSDQRAFRYSANLRLDGLAQNINKEKDKYFKGIEGVLNFSYRKNPSDSVTLMLADKIDLIGSELKDYGFKDYNVNVMYNTAYGVAAWDVSRKSALEFKVENEFIKTMFRPYDANVLTLAEFMLDEVIFNRINDEVLYYQMPGAVPVHNRYLLSIDDLVNEVHANTVFLVADHMITRYSFAAFSGRYEHRDYLYDNTLDNRFASGEMRFYNFFPGTKYLDWEAFSESQYEDKKVNKYDDFRRVKEYFRGQKSRVKIPGDRFFEARYRYDEKKLKKVTSGGYDLHSFQFKFGQDVGTKGNFTIEDRFDVRNYDPEGLYFSDYRSNYLSTGYELKLDKDTSIMSDLGFRFYRHPESSEEDYNTTNLRLYWYQLFPGGRGITVGSSLRWHDYAEEDDTRQGYRKTVFSGVFNQELGNKGGAQVGVEWQDMAYGSGSQYYSDYDQVTLALRLYQRLSSWGSLELGWKHEDLDFSANPKDDRESSLTRIALSVIF